LIPYRLLELVEQQLDKLNNFVCVAGSVDSLHWAINVKRAPIDHNLYAAFSAAAIFNGRIHFPFVGDQLRCGRLGSGINPGDVLLEVWAEVLHASPIGVAFRAYEHTVVQSCSPPGAVLDDVVDCRFSKRDPMIWARTSWILAVSAITIPNDLALK
jgi:hypothetical protein